MESGDKYNRKAKSLGLLCENFIGTYGQVHGDIISLDDASLRLGVPRRRLYDVVNVLESIHIVSRQQKNRYMWLGFENVAGAMRRLRSGNLAGPKELSPCGTDGELDDGLTDSDAPKTPQVGNHRREKSLAMLSKRFVQMLLAGTPGQDTIVTLDAASRRLEDESDSNPCKKKTRARRLYDIANILSSLRLIEKTQSLDGRKPAFRWCYLNPFNKQHVIADSPPAYSARPEPPRRPYEQIKEEAAPRLRLCGQVRPAKFPPLLTSPFASAPQQGPRKCPADDLARGGGPCISECPAGVMGPVPKKPRSSLPVRRSVNQAQELYPETPLPVAYASVRNPFRRDEHSQLVQEASHTMTDEETLQDFQYHNPHSYGPTEDSGPMCGGPSYETLPWSHTPPDTCQVPNQMAPSSQHNFQTDAIKQALSSFFAPSIVNTYQHDQSAVSSLVSNMLSNYKQFWQQLHQLNNVAPSSSSAHLLNSLPSDDEVQDMLGVNQRQDVPSWPQHHAGIAPAANPNYGYNPTGISRVPALSSYAPRYTAGNEGLQGRESGGPIDSFESYAAALSGPNGLVNSLSGQFAASR
eukprot:jgi/Botrbrau1/9544/Bobra.0089s0005.1